MTNEQERLNRRMIGLEKWEDEFSSSAENRTPTCPYTYNDLAYNINGFPYTTDMAIIVTSYWEQLKWLKATLMSYRLSGKYVILSYDNPFYPWEYGKSLDSRMPRDDHFKLVHGFVMKHKTFDFDKRTGWFWDVKYAQGLINLFPNIKYVYCTNGDCIWDKPTGADDLVRLLGDGDLMSGQSEPGRTIHTASVLYKVEAFNKIVNFMTERMKVQVMPSHSPETMLRDAVNIFKMKETFVPKQPRDANGNIDWYTQLNNDSTYKDLVGFRNLFGEMEYAAEHRKEPLDKKYLDFYNDGLYMKGLERDSVYNYYMTGDRRYIPMWWDRSADSDKIIIKPVEYYGEEPIYDNG